MGEFFVFFFIIVLFHSPRCFGESCHFEFQWVRFDALLIILVVLDVVEYTCALSHICERCLPCRGLG